MTTDQQTSRRHSRILALMDGVRRYKSSITSVHSGDREITPGANRPPRINLSMHRKSNLLSDDVGSQIINQLSKGRQLIGSGFCFFKIADQTNPYAHLVDILAVNMPAFQLLQPSRPDLNLAISRINPVANHKMISQSILHTAFSMCPVVDCRVAVFDGAMVSHNPLPAPGRYRKCSGLLANTLGVKN